MEGNIGLRCRKGKHEDIIEEIVLQTYLFLFFFLIIKVTYLLKTVWKMKIKRRKLKSLITPLTNIITVIVACIGHTFFPPALLRHN